MRNGFRSILPRMPKTGRLLGRLEKPVTLSPLASPSSGGGFCWRRNGSFGPTELSTHLMVRLLVWTAHENTSNRPCETRCDCGWKNVPSLPWSRTVTTTRSLWERAWTSNRELVDDSPWDYRVLDGRVATIGPRRGWMSGTPTQPVQSLLPLIYAAVCVGQGRYRHRHGPKERPGVGPLGLCRVVADVGGPLVVSRRRSFKTAQASQQDCG
jgi:hypothetical protein